MCCATGNRKTLRPTIPEPRRHENSAAAAAAADCYFCVRVKRQSRPSLLRLECRTARVQPPGVEVPRSTATCGRGRSRHPGQTSRAEPPRPRKAARACRHARDFRCRCPSSARARGPFGAQTQWLLRRMIIEITTTTTATNTTTTTTTNATAAYFIDPNRCIIWRPARPPVPCDRPQNC